MTSVKDRAVALGLPKGIVRTAVDVESFSSACDSATSVECLSSTAGAASRKLYGSIMDANPVQQARIKRERAGQHALAKARRVIAAQNRTLNIAEVPATSSLTDRFSPSRALSQ